MLSPRRYLNPSTRSISPQEDPSLERETFPLFLAKMPFLSPPAIFVLIGGATALLYYFYKKALPQPIPGIPHNHGSEKRILGDMPGMISAVLKTEQIFPWMTSQNIKLNSPIIQLFCRPLQKPWVVITDFRESQDILLRRTREFDRSDFLGDVFIGLTPDMHISMKSYEERFKQHRNLLKDLMTLGFLNEVSHSRSTEGGLQAADKYEGRRSSDLFQRRDAA